MQERRNARLRPAWWGAGSRRASARGFRAASSRVASTSCDAPSGCSRHSSAMLSFCRLPFRNRGAPIAEHRLHLLRRALRRRALTRISRTFCGSGSAAASGCIGDRQAEAAQVVVLVVVAVPAAVILRQVEWSGSFPAGTKRASRNRKPLCATDCAGPDRHRCPKPFRPCRRWRSRSARLPGALRRSCRRKSGRAAFRRIDIGRGLRELELRDLGRRVGRRRLRP